MGDLQIIILRLNLLSLAGVEDGQTVRMPVGKREIFITFRVGALLAQPLLGLTVVEKVQPRLLMEGWSFMGYILPTKFPRRTVATWVGLLNMLSSIFCARCGENRVALRYLLFGNKHKNTENVLCFLLMYQIVGRDSKSQSIYRFALVYTHYVYTRENLVF